MARLVKSEYKGPVEVKVNKTGRNRNSIYPSSLFLL